MATRNSPVRRLPGNPLGGVLRQTARAARSTTRRAVAVPGPEGPQGPPGQPAGGVTVTAVAVLTCDDMGVADWTFPVAAVHPVVLATPFGPQPVIVTVSGLGTSGATFVAYDNAGATVPGQVLHVALFELQSPATPVDSTEQPEQEGP